MTKALRTTLTALAAAALLAGGAFAASPGRHGHASGRTASTRSNRSDHRRTTPTTTTAPRTTTTTSTTTTTPTPTTTTTPATTTTPTTTTTGTTSSYPWHTNIVATTFWVGEVYKANASDGSQACSTYDSDWAYHWSGGVDVGTAPSGTSCAGSPIGGCDGVASGSGSNFTCTTERRTAANDWFPTSPNVHPAENPFYLDLPFDDVNNAAAFKSRGSVIPWVSEYPASDVKNPNFSYMKNRWVEITGPNGKTAYGQIEDAGPFAYDDAAYVFGSNDARPQSKQANNAGLDVSPALNSYLGFKELDGDSDHVSWRFVEQSDVPAGPWLDVVTTSPVDEG